MACIRATDAGTPGMAGGAPTSIVNAFRLMHVLLEALSAAAMCKEWMHSSVDQETSQLRIGTMHNLFSDIWHNSTFHIAKPVNFAILWVPVFVG